MPKPPPKPYRTTTPWTGFTPREKKREKPLARCPVMACRRAKQCIRAIDALYCRRTHLSPDEVRAMAKADAAPRPLIMYRLPANASLEQAEAYRIGTEMLLSQVEAAQARMTSKWKQGAFDHLYGPYDPKGVVLVAPPRKYVE